MSTVHYVCHVCIFCYWDDGRDQNKNDFLKSGTDLEVINLETKSRIAQNVRTKRAFLPLFFVIIEVCASNYQPCLSLSNNLIITKIIEERF